VNGTKTIRYSDLWGSREEKYRNFYLIYETLLKDPDPELRSIRHSLSHARKKLTDEKTSLILLSLFGNLKIDLTKYKHAKIFRKKLDILKRESERLLVEEILRILPKEKNFEGYFYMP